MLGRPADRLCPPCPADNLCPPCPANSLCPPCPADSLCPPCGPGSGLLPPRAGPGGGLCAGEDAGQCESLLPPAPPQMVPSPENSVEGAKAPEESPSTRCLLCRPWSSQGGSGLGREGGKPAPKRPEGEGAAQVLVPCVHVCACAGVSVGGFSEDCVCLLECVGGGGSAQALGPCVHVCACAGVSVGGL